MSTQRLQRLTNWNREMRKATPAQFRKLLTKRSELRNVTLAQFCKLGSRVKRMDKVTKLAVYAGKKMAYQLARAGNTVQNLDAEQVERWRRAYCVPVNRTNVMLCVAWSSLHYPRRKVIFERKAKKEAPRPRPVVVKAKMSLGRQGAAKFCSYLAKQRRALRLQPRTVNAQKVAPVKVVRLLSHKKTYTPTLCAMCTTPVSIGGTIFCNGCQPQRG
jgi:hypothetical protein